MALYVYDGLWIFFVCVFPSSSRVAKNELQLVGLYQINEFSEKENGGARALMLLVKMDHRRTHTSVAGSRFPFGLFFYLWTVVKYNTV